MMKWLNIVLVATVSTILISCFHDNNDDATIVPATSGPTLTAADKNTVTPCPNQDILTDATELAALKDALLTGALSFRDVPFVNTPNIFKQKCGLEGFWDPANNTDEITPAFAAMSANTLSQLVQFGRAGICSTNAIPPDTITDTGFPVAGIYRGEIKAAKGGSTWHLRYRGTASGSSAGNSFAAETIIVPGDIESTLEYKVNGTVTAHDGLLAAIVNAASTSGVAILLEVSKTAGGATVFSMSIELICVTKS